MSERDFDKNLELHESEWKKTGKREPIFGPGAAWFFQVALPTGVIALAAGFVLKFIVYGLFG